MPIYVPRELIHAAGMLPLGILGAGENLEVIHGDAYYQSYICRIPRSTLELGITGPARLRRRVPLPVDLRRDPQSLGHVEAALPEGVRALLRRPAELRGRHGRRVLRARAPRAAEELEKLGGTRSPTTSCGPRSRSTTRTAGWSATSMPSGPGALAGARRPRSTCSMRAGMILPVEEHSQLLRDYLAAARAEPRPRRDNCRVVLNGAVLRAAAAQPHQGDRAVRAATSSTTTSPGEPLAHRGRPAERRPASSSSRSAFLHHSMETSAKYQPVEGEGQVPRRRGEGQRRGGRHLRGAELLRSGAARSADAGDALDRVDVPHIGFKYAENSGQMQPVREQAGTFADSIKLWSTP